ncbi:patatin-like phospholipase family protein [Marinitoga aeolica]|uniref:Patatin-like phospholipase family protein n=1 Tax=Marinitoga aeolica TaxID=2809031 RepID=A0ABY8PTA6_9BACT|nr:patatin-like phospholipase family protein [Marinitoga aeolica]WGS65871.1 patatin-like phospholipase family protein [Marinitoga aeolica]
MGCGSIKKFIVILLLLLNVIVFSKTLLVLGGGGAAGAYEIGVLKYITENNVEIDGIYGVSAGALNGAGFVMGKLDEVEKLWKSIDDDDIFDLNIKDHHPKLKPFVFDPSPLYTFLKKIISEDLILKSKYDYGILTFNMTDFKPVFIRKEEMKGKMVDFIFASASYPLFGAIEIDGKKYTDGGVFSNTYPALLAEKYGYDEVIAVYPVIDLPTDWVIYSILKTKKNIIIIRPSDSVPFPLDFSPDYSKTLIEMGYEDAKKILSKK